MTEEKMVFDKWFFKASERGEWFPATVPGCVHSDLFHNKQIPDPFVGINERDLQWIDKKDWEYETIFDLSENLIKHANIELVFEGLDTYAEVFLNGERILFADNMFRSWKIEIKRLLKEKNNKLRIYFHSPIKKGLEKLEALGYVLPASNDVSEMGGIGDKKVSIFTRKAPYHFGWDWGPRFVTSGIWKDIYLVGWTDAKITDFFIKQNRVNQSLAQLTAAIEVEAEASFKGILDLSTDGVKVEKEVTLKKGLNTVEVDLEIAYPNLWWSRGLGEPHLYQFVATLFRGNTNVTHRSVKTGLRSLKLIQEKDEKGTSFYFELNGVPVFAKGANHIPNDSFLTEITKERYQYEIQSAVESNMNMLRVWGGGIYEYDVFYDLCDEYGILVWQDFMFACSMYPGDEAFLRNVQLEAEENIKRLRNHPSIALWCGNNENDIAWSQYDEKAGWGWKEQYTPELRDKIWGDYEVVFNVILPKAVSKNAPGTDYWPSSPLSKWSGDINQHAKNDSTSGDIHYWGVWHGLEPFENYNTTIGRFASEYGFQSFPEEQTVRAYAEEKDMELESDVMLLHQKNGRGNLLIKEYMKKYFKDAKDFPSFLYMSQVQQAEAIKMAIEAHRRNKPYCMGSLYWQMNDCWPVASWSSMDYYGRWKALQYYAKKSFKDVALSIDGTGDSIDIYIVSDVLLPTLGTLHVQLLNFYGEILHEWEQPVDVEANTSKSVWSLSQNELLGDHDEHRVLLNVILKREEANLDTKDHFFVPIKDIELPTPNIIMKEVKNKNGSKFTLETDVLAKQVWLFTETKGIFSDNYFDLIPGVPYTIGFYKQDQDQPSFVPASPGKITIRSMVDFITE
jgi:beta-mannosidase